MRWSPDGTRLTIESNGNYGIDSTTVIAAADAPAVRPVRNLVVTQTVDARAMRASDAGREIVLEVRATGRGGTRRRLASTSQGRAAADY